MKKQKYIALYRCLFLVGNGKPPAKQEKKEMGGESDTTQPIGCEPAPAEATNQPSSTSASVQRLKEMKEKAELRNTRLELACGIMTVISIALIWALFLCAIHDDKLRQKIVRMNTKFDKERAVLREDLLRNVTRIAELKAQMDLMLDYIRYIPHLHDDIRQLNKTISTLNNSNQAPMNHWRSDIFTYAIDYSYEIIIWPIIKETLSVIHFLVYCYTRMELYSSDELRIMKSCVRFLFRWVFSSLFWASLLLAFYKWMKGQSEDRNPSKSKPPVPVRRRASRQRTTNTQSNTAPSQQ